MIPTTKPLDFFITKQINRIAHECHVEQPGLDTPDLTNKTRNCASPVEGDAVTTTPMLNSPDIQTTHEIKRQNKREGERERKKIKENEEKRRSKPSGINENPRLREHHARP